MKTSTSTLGPHLNCKIRQVIFLVSEPMTINIQNRQHIRPFSPFNSVRAAFLKSCLCFLCPYGACVCCHPNLHFSFQSESFKKMKGSSYYGPVKVSSTDWTSTMAFHLTNKEALRADVSKYRPEVCKSEKSKILKIHKLALGKLITQI